MDKTFEKFGPLHEVCGNGYHVPEYVEVDSKNPTDRYCTKCKKFFFTKPIFCEENMKIQEFDYEFNEDQRAQRGIDIFNTKTPFGYVISYSIVNPGHIVAWHGHRHCTDRWTCLKGKFMVGLAVPKNKDIVIPRLQDVDVWHINPDDYDVEWHTISDKNRRTIIIPTGVWHGYKSLMPESILLYHLSHEYNNTDEFRLSVNYFGEGDWSVENK
jgi:dTDP-4-dehydrorhamnose 3,5-epimerase-like enzyme